MKRFAYWGGLAFALAVLTLSVTNASWLAPYPAGAPKQIAHRAIGLEFDPPQYSPIDLPDPCDAAQIYAPTSRHLPNTLRGILRADRMGGWLIEVDPQLTADGEIVLFAYSALDCFTDGEGAVSAHGLAELQALDAGFGYFTADTGGRVYPYRGQGAVMPTLAEVARTIPRQARLMIHLTGDDTKLALAVISALETAGRDPVDKGDAFYGSANLMTLIRKTYPGIWAFNAEEARQCTADYKKVGWIGVVPTSCDSGTMLIALDDQALLWGWPNRLIARMQAADVQILIEGPGAVTQGEIAGITLPEQLTEIPGSFNGYIWTDDAFNTLPALIQRYDNRNQEEIDAAQAALDRRRAAP
jgi:glycerophosphoryl diester phosphodiesterase